MAARQIDFPDEFYKEMIKEKQRSGATFRRQVLEAMCIRLGWTYDRIPIDGRSAFGWEKVSGEAEIPKFPEAFTGDGWGEKKGDEF